MKILLFFLVFQSFNFVAKGQQKAVVDVSYDDIKRFIEKFKDDDVLEQLDNLAKLRGKTDSVSWTLNANVLKKTDTIDFTKVNGINVLKQNECFELGTDKYICKINFYYPPDTNLIMARLIHKKEMYLIKDKYGYWEVEKKKLSKYSKVDIYKFLKQENDTTLYKGIPFHFTITDLGSVAWDRTSVQVIGGSISGVMGNYTVLATKDKVELKISQQSGDGSVSKSFTYNLEPTPQLIRYKKKK